MPFAVFFYALWDPCYLGFVCRERLSENSGDGIERDCFYCWTDHIEGRELETNFTRHGDKEDCPSVFCCVAGSGFVHRHCEEMSANEVVACWEKDTDTIGILVLQTPSTVLTYSAGYKTVFCQPVEYCRSGFPLILQFSTAKAAESRRLS